MKYKLNEFLNNYINLKKLLKRMEILKVQLMLILLYLNYKLNVHIRKGYKKKII